MSGGFGDDTQDGGPGNDRIFANLGADTTDGGPGDDVLFALARRDVHGPNDLTGDTVRGGPGNDRIRVRDGEQDTVNCGEGDDVAFLDFKDRIEDATDANPKGSCEVVRRHAPRRSDSRAEDRTQSPAEDREQG
jgi:Ca2+-binding RTX toxin-like protein